MKKINGVARTMFISSVALGATLSASVGFAADTDRVHVIKDRNEMVTHAASMNDSRLKESIAPMQVDRSLNYPKRWSDRRLVHRGGTGQDSLIHTVTDTDVPPNDSWPQNENYSRYGSQLWGLREDGASQSERSRYGMEDKPSSSGEERQVDTSLHGDYFRNDQSSASPTAPFSEMIYGRGPTTPSADPMIKELSREPSTR